MEGNDGLVMKPFGDTMLATIPIHGSGNAFVNGLFRPNSQISVQLSLAFFLFGNE